MIYFMPYIPTTYTNFWVWPKVLSPQILMSRFYKRLRNFHYLFVYLCVLGFQDWAEKIIFKYIIIRIRCLKVIFCVFLVTYCLLYLWEDLLYLLACFCLKCQSIFTAKILHFPLKVCILSRLSAHFSYLYFNP